MSALHAAHLARRFFGSLSRREPAGEDVAWAHNHLLPREVELWDAMTVQDRRHSLLVTRRFAALVQDPTRAQLAGALLHDLGKAQSDLGTIGRVVATIVGPRTARFRSYHEHEALGCEMLSAAGSEMETLALVDGTSDLSQALRAADSV